MLTPEQAGSLTSQVELGRPPMAADLEAEFNPQHLLPGESGLDITKILYFTYYAPSLVDVQNLDPDLVRTKTRYSKEFVAARNRLQKMASAAIKSALERSEDPIHKMMFNMAKDSGANDYLELGKMCEIPPSSALELYTAYKALPIGTAGNYGPGYTK